MKINLENYNSNLVLHYGGKSKAIEAKTFAASIYDLVTALEEISYISNPGYQLVVDIETFSPGSFRPKIRLEWKPIFSAAKQYLPEKNQTLPILLAVLALFNCGGNEEQTIVKNNEQVVIINGDVHVEMNADTFDQANKMQTNKNIRKSISRHFQTIDQNPEVENFGITDTLESEDYGFFVDRPQFAGFTSLDEVESADDPREIVVQNAELKLIKVVLERGLRKWEFVWKGHKISAPILDDKFWQKIENRTIEISQGDTIEVDLRIAREFDPIAKVHINESYEVLRVLEYKKAYKQRDDLFP